MKLILFWGFSLAMAGLLLSLFLWLNWRSWKQDPKTQALPPPWRTWLGLCGVILLCTVGLYLFLGRVDSIHSEGVQLNKAMHEQMQQGRQHLFASGGSMAQWLLLIELEKTLQRPQQRLQSLRQANQAYPDQNPLLPLLAEQLAQLNERWDGEPMRLIQRAYTQYPNDIDVNLLWALAQVSQGQLRQVKQAWQASNQPMHQPLLKLIERATSATQAQEKLVDLLKFLRQQRKSSVMPSTQN